MFGYEQQTTGIGNQCDECDSHHHQRFRLTTEYKASHHLYEYANSQDQLQYTRKMRGDRPFVMCNLRAQGGLDEVIRFIEKQGMLTAAA